MKKLRVLFVVLCMGMLLTPFVGMLWTDTADTLESGESTVTPSLTEDGGVNLSYLSDWGDYFTEQFAWRQEMVTLNAMLYRNVFRMSTTDQVLLGKKGWLYYTSTLNDYTGEHLATTRGLANVVHNLSLIQDYVEAQGSQFLFTIAPNKNSLYAENMPYYYQKREQENNYERLKPMLEEAGIHYVDLFEAFEESDEILYFRTDSHWTNRGAVLAYNTIMAQTDLEYETYETISYAEEENHIGDLESMLSPLFTLAEKNESYQKQWTYVYENAVTDNMDDWIKTTSSANDKCLLMYRDSFGESLLPFFAEEFGTGYFSRLVPYNLNEVAEYGADYTVVERVERRLLSLAESAAIMEPPTTELSLTQELESDTTLEITQDGDYYILQGIVDDSCMGEDTAIYLCLTDTNGERIYETFHISLETEEGVNDNGYMIYLPAERLIAGQTRIQVCISDDGKEGVCVAEKQCR